MAQISSNKCHNCEKDNAGLYCYECQYFLCAPCRLIHDKFLKKHTVTESGKIDRSVFASRLKCERHDLEFAHYCKDCKCLTCSECTTSGHKSHEFTEVSEVAASIRTDLNQANCNVKAKLDILSRLIDEIENVKMKNVKEENNQFVEDARKIARELIRMIESVTEQTVNRASDFLILEQQNIAFELAKIKKLQKDCTSVTDRIEQLTKIEHDMTFYVQQKSLTKEKTETDSIPMIIGPNKIGEFKNEDFIDQVVETIQSKYSIR
ncbi:unnamed protein product [Mytilus coruscus]|uniref:B box-type domain-containing protein n=1 Tax=Mytilus coruscus TaxID=42192 RepID=A0A6J8E0P5_MYTCO|nr:unnamed protein product [Mytilus coruscus]